MDGILSEIRQQKPGKRIKNSNKGPLATSAEILHNK
jgi:hypothetical protein